MSQCGFIALIGAPNAGKSTLLNALVGAKIAIVSPKIQTTRNRILGIVNEGEAQLLFVDTPGIFAPRRRLDRAMVAAAWTGAEDADAIVLLVDATGKKISAETRTIIDKLKAAGRKVIGAITKVDLVDPGNLLPLAAQLNETGIVSDIFMISAPANDGLDDLKNHLIKMLPQGPHLYPDDELSDQPMRRIAAEVTREQLYLQLEKELPYASTVETETWEEFDNGSVKLTQVIFVARDSQKKIILGKGGARIKEIGSKARAELETMLGRRVHLSLFVKVREGWGEDAERYREMGLEYDV